MNSNIVSRLNDDFQRPIRTVRFDLETEQAFDSFYDTCYKLENCIDRIRIILYNR